jgi:ABC-type nitrate/sulfonate/bicarbonate transport system substrate-binding protein
MNFAPMTVGFVPLLDCAPLVVAAERGFAAAEGLELRLVRETSWANIRDRVVVGQFQAAHMLGPMPIASTLGIGHLTVPMIAPVALGSGGNAVTVANALWDAMVRQGARVAADPKAQGTALHAVVRERMAAGAAPLTLAMVYPFSCHHYELRYWLAACGIDPDNDVRLVVIPPPFMVDALREGQIDGFCVGEPWNTLAVEAGVASIATVTTAIWQRSPEKVLGMRADWAAAHPQQTLALVRAIYQACLWCDRQSSRDPLAQLLARPEFVGESAQNLGPALTGRLRFTSNTAPTEVPEFQTFAGHGAAIPRPIHALWFYSQMLRWRQTAGSQQAAAAAAATFRPDLFREALRTLAAAGPTADSRTMAAVDRGHADPLDHDRLTGFFDGGVFDPHDLNESSAAP